MKVDAEGAELEVLLGARKTIQRCQPAISLSLHPAALTHAGGTLAEVWHLLQHYRMATYCSDRLVDEAWFCRQTNLFDVQLLPLQ
jgi:hypothetical protein